MNNGYLKEWNIFLDSKNLRKKTRKDINKSLTKLQKIKILKNKSNNINDIILFLNSNVDIIKNLFDIIEGDMGKGEIALLLVSTNSQKIKERRKKSGDIQIDNKDYEIKLTNSKELIRAGGKFKIPVYDLTNTLWLLKGEIFEGMDKEKYKNLLGEDIFKKWNEFGKKDKPVEWTSFSKKKLKKLRPFLEELKKKLNEALKLEEILKLNYVVEDKILQINKEDWKKIKQSNVGQNINISGEIIDLTPNYHEIKHIRSIIKFILNKKTFKMSGEEIDNEIKNSFIEDLSGGLIMVSLNKFEFINKENFIKRFDFAGITQGNRPLFSFKSN